jgi:hypothetical protein
MKTLIHINTVTSLSNIYVRIGLTIVGVVAAVICLLTLMSDVSGIGKGFQLVSSLY